MNTLIQTVQTEPALVGGVVSAALSLAVSFGIHLTGDQVGGIMAVTAAVTAVLVRGAHKNGLPPPSTP